MFVKGIGYCIASIWLLQLAATNATPATDERIVGGQTTTIDHFPFLVQIWNNGQFICGGSVLAPKFVVTAAHCVEGVYAPHLTVVGGATKLGEPGVSRKVDDIMRHSNFSSDTLDYDVAILKLLNTWAGTNIVNITLYTGELKTGMDVVVSGWGLTSENAINPSERLKTITVPITERATCVKEYEGYKVHVTKNMFCASLPGTKDACAGDSGGPATIDGKLAGIVSTGKGCAHKENSGIYTDIQQVKESIEMWLKS